MKVILDTKALQNIKVFQTMTSLSVLDCIENDETLYFVVKGRMSESPVRKRFERTRNVERIFRKKVRVFEFSSDPRTFMKRIVPEAFEIEIIEKTVRIKVKNCFKPKVIGKNKKNLIIIKSLLKRFYEIDDVKVV